MARCVTAGRLVKKRKYSFRQVLAESSRQAMLTKRQREGTSLERRLLDFREHEMTSENIRIEVREQRRMAWTKAGGVIFLFEPDGQR